MINFKNNRGIKSGRMTLGDKPVVIKDGVFSVPDDTPIEELERLVACGHKCLEPKKLAALKPPAKPKAEEKPAPKPAVPAPAPDPKVEAPTTPVEEAKPEDPALNEIEMALLTDVKGIGTKTATKILEKYGDLANVNKKTAKVLADEVDGLTETEAKALLEKLSKL